jgi:hypothetical protein
MAKEFVRKIKLTFDYNEVKEGVKETNKQLKMLNNEYKAVKAESRATGKAIDMLASRKDYLTERIKILNGALDEYKKRLDAAKEKDNAKAVENYAEKIQKTETELRALQADLGAVNKKLDEQKGFLGKSTEEWDKMSKKLKDTGKDLSLKVTAPIMAAGAAAFKMGGDYEQALGKMNDVFGENNKAVKDWLNTSMESFGLSKLSAAEMIADFGALFDNFGFKIEETTKMSQSLVERVRDLGARYNKSSEETANALNAIFTGQTEPLRKFGVVLNQASLQEYAYAQGIRKKISEMTEAEKVQLRYNFVMAQTSTALGYFKKEHNTASAQLENFREIVKEIGVTFGEVIIPVFGPILNGVNNVLKYIAGLDQGTRKFIVTIALMAASIGPLLVGAAKIIEATKAVKEITGGLGKAIKGVSKVNKVFGSVLENSTFLKLAKWAALLMGVAIVIWMVIESINALIGRKSSVQGTIEQLGKLGNGVKMGKIRGYAVGSKYIEQDQLAMIHRGEAVIPAKNNPWNPNASEPYGGNKGGDIILNVKMDEVGEVYKLIDTVKKARQMQRAGVVSA